MKHHHKRYKVVVLSFENGIHVNKPIMLLFGLLIKFVNEVQSVRLNLIRQRSLYGCEFFED